MKRTTLSLAISSAISVCVLSACGSDGGGSSSNNAQVGVLSDALVKGVAYEASPSGLKGETNESGQFHYEENDKVGFKIGAVSLGDVDMSAEQLSIVDGQKHVRPKDLAGVMDETDEKSLAIAQLIQAAAGSPDETAEHIDVSAHSNKFKKVGAVTGLDDVDDLLPEGLEKPELDKVAKHLLNQSHVKAVRFTETAIDSLTAEQRAKPYTSSVVEVSFANGEVKTYPLSYVTLFNNTDTDKTVDAFAAAALRNKQGEILKDAENNPYIPQAPDANSLLNIAGSPYLVTHWEYETSNYGKLPMMMTQAKLKQDQATGILSVDGKSIKPIDFSAVNGLWIPCAGSRSPWNTHLGSEEYEPDARCEIDGAYAASSNNCLAGKGDFTARVSAFRELYGATDASPYHYGLIPEVTVNHDGTTSVEKWYTLGRLSHEKAVFFGDARTAIQGDDGTYTMMTMFVADKAKDLSVGTLYAAKWHQTSADNGGAATLEWIKLGHTSHEAIKAAVEAGVKFSDLFETSNEMADGFTAIVHGHDFKTKEYLKLKTGQFHGVDIATLAAFLETRRYGVLLGATSEFEKFEGVAYNARDNKAYIAMARVSSGMEEGSDVQDDIRLAKNNSGIVYELTLATAQKDSTNKMIKSVMVPKSIKALVVGEDMEKDVEGNISALNNIASPDNLAYSERMRVLFIGEDSSNHVNNYLWAYHLDSQKLVRILSLPMGAESTGLQAVDNLNGWSYVMSNYQHAGDKNKTAQATYDAIIGHINPNQAAVGYLSGLPAMH